jgi:hypothetical protein
MSLDTTSGAEMTRGAGFQIALAATLTLLLGGVPALAVTNPLVLFKAKDCGTSNACLLSFAPVPAGVRWEVRQIGCADALAPTTVNLTAVFLVVKQDHDIIKAVYPFAAVTGSGIGYTNWMTEATVFIPIASGQQIQFVFPTDGTPSGQRIQCTLAGASITN